MSKSTYDADFYAWANEQAALLRAGKLSDADIANIAEEIESMGRSEKRALVSRLTVLLLHLLKCRFQPQRRGRSWEVSIANARDDLADHLADNPSLKAVLPEATPAAKSGALIPCKPIYSSASNSIDLIAFCVLRYPPGPRARKRISAVAVSCLVGAGKP